MCSTIREPGKPERVLGDCGHCMCPNSRNLGNHIPVDKPVKDKDGNVITTWRECDRCHTVGV